jgi:muramoyltetrapeptide carboxypeptidase LdcA involved in peptidoglycan recycling
MIKQGDTIGIIALAGNCDAQSVLKAKQNFENIVGLLDLKEDNKFKLATNSK